jgi:hypothetical protein
LRKSFHDGLGALNMQNGRPFDTSAKALALIAAVGFAGATHATSSPDPSLSYVTSNLTSVADLVNIQQNGAYSTSAYSLNPLGTQATNQNLSSTSSTAGVPVATSSIAVGNSSIPTVATYYGGGSVLSTISGTASQQGLTGFSSAAGAAAWDLLTFYGTPGQKVTFSETFTLATTGTDASGNGGVCISVGAACGPSIMTLLSTANPSHTLTANATLTGTSTQLLIYNALYVDSGGGPNATTAAIDPNFVVTLPAGVTFTAASGNPSGGSPVPLPASAWLMLSGLVGIGAMAHKRRAA